MVSPSLFRSSTGLLVIALLIIFHLFVWFDKIDKPSAIDYGLAVAGIVALWRHKKHVENRNADGD